MISKSFWEGNGDSVHIRANDCVVRGGGKTIKPLKTNLYLQLRNFKKTHLA